MTKIETFEIRSHFNFGHVCKKKKKHFGENQILNNTIGGFL